MKNLIRLVLSGYAAYFGFGFGIAFAGDYDDIGQACYDKGLYEKAEGYFNQAVQADPNDWVGYQGLGNCYLQLDDKTDALDAFHKSLEINPDNPTLRSLVKTLQGSEGPSAPDTGNPTPSQAQTFADGLPSMDHSRFWTQVELGYNYSIQGDFIDSANSFNQGKFDPSTAITTSVSYLGSASTGNSAFQCAGELGFLPNPYFGIALGVRVMAGPNYSSTGNYDTGDSEQLTLTPAVVPITLDLYLFLPHPGGRFFLSGGLGYYLGIMEVDQTTSSNNYFGTDNGNFGNGSNEWTGRLYGGCVGFQLGLGHDFKMNDQIGFGLYVRGRFAKISNYQGTLTDSAGNNLDYALAATTSTPTVVDVEPASGVSGNKRYAVVDLTGFDVGLSINFYNFW